MTLGIFISSVRNECFLATLCRITVLYDYSLPVGLFLTAFMQTLRVDFLATIEKDVLKFNKKCLIYICLVALRAYVDWQTPLTVTSLSSP